jgi:hypothetical protein
MADNGKTQDLKDLARGLDALTDEGGPLLLLISEVRRSNRLALRNVRLQIMSLATLALCLVLLAALSYFFQQGLMALTESKSQLEGVTKQLNSTQSAVTTVDEKLSAAPKIVADDSGQLRVVATIERPEEPKPVVGTVAKAARSIESETLEIPIDMKDAYAK